VTSDEALERLRELETAPADELFEDSMGSHPRPNEGAIERARAFLGTVDDDVVDVDIDVLGGIAVYVRDEAGLLTWYAFMSRRTEPYKDEVEQQRDGVKTLYDTTILLNGPKDCRTCGRPVEEPRRIYAIPTCYACLPPPEPLPIAPMGRSKEGGSRGGV
jgi:hypothetical protein